MHNSYASGVCLVFFLTPTDFLSHMGHSCYAVMFMSPSNISKYTASHIELTVFKDASHVRFLLSQLSE